MKTDDCSVIISCRKWITAAGRKDLEGVDIEVINKNYRICNIHFALSSRLNRRLKCDVVPTLHLPNIFLTKSTQTETGDDLTNSHPSTSGSQSNEETTDHLSQNEGSRKRKLSETSSSSEQSESKSIKIENDIPQEPESVFVVVQNGIECTQNWLKVDPGETETKDDLTNSRPSTSGLQIQSDDKTTDYLSQSEKRMLNETSLSSEKLVSESIKIGIDIPQKPESEFVVAQNRIEYIKNRLKVHPGYIFDNSEYKKFIMNLYFASPLAYRFLYKTLKLPDEKFLREMNIDIDPNLSDTMIRCLEYKCQRLTSTEKVCVVSVTTLGLTPEISTFPHRQVVSNSNTGFQEINNKQPHDLPNLAVVVMARSLFSKWTQLIAFCLKNPLSNYAEVADWLIGIVEQVIEIGFYVAALTTDSDPLFFAMTNNHHRYMIQSPLDACQTFFVFDVPTILNSLRNELLKNRFLFPDGGITDLCASWDDIQNLFKVEKSKNCRIAHKLTISHVKPTAYEKTTVKFAAQVFSRSVAVAIQFNIGSGKLPHEALGTGIFARRLNDVFDILNSCPKISSESSCKFKKRYSCESYQTNNLQGFLRLLSKLQVINKANKDITLLVNCINHFKTTITSILNLSAHLKNKGFHYFYTRRLNIDVLKDFFHTLRRNRGHCREPTAEVFCGEFKKHFLNAAIDTHKINIASEINILFSAIDDVYNEVQIENEFSEYKSNQIEELEDEHMKLIAIISEEGIISNQSDDSESEKDDNNEFLQCKSNQYEEKDEEENEYPEIKSDYSGTEDVEISEIESNQNKEEKNESSEIRPNQIKEEENEFPEINTNQIIGLGSNKNKEIKEESELYALNEEIENIMKDVQTTTVCTSVFKEEID